MDNQQGVAELEHPARIAAASPKTALPKPPAGMAGEFWGGLAAMLVALPSAIAFGVTIFAPLGSGFASQGAIAGILGTFAVGMTAAMFGGTNRLISAPCAPATAVMGSFALEMAQRKLSPDQIIVLMAVVALACGGIQILLGVLRVGRLIKYMPYPVVSGYLSGVGLIIIITQIPKLLGVPSNMHLTHAVSSVASWNWNSVIIGVATIASMVLAPKVTKKVPAAILALATGIAVYFLLGLRDSSMLTLPGNKMVVGMFGGSATDSFRAIGSRWHAIGALNLGMLELVVMPALTLAVLLSIDTLKTCIVLDAITRTRHDSNRELVGQGLGNLASVVLGGVPGSGQMGATLVNVSSGGTTRWSGVMEGGLALVAFLLLAKFVAWVPIATLAGILIVVGVRMFDRNSLHLLRSRSTILDFAVIVAVVLVAETVSLIAASAVGVGLAIMLFLREQVGGNVVRRKTYGNQVFSKKIRLAEEMEILTQRGDCSVIFELQGSLFFGTTDQLLTALEPELKQRTYIVLDMRRVQLVDVTAMHTLERIEDAVSDNGGFLIFSHFPRSVPSGQQLQEYFDEVGLARRKPNIVIFRELHDALEWIEDGILADAHMQRAEEQPLQLSEIEIFSGRKQETLDALEKCMEKRSIKAGERIFQRKENGDELFLIRRGLVRITLPLKTDPDGHHLATFGRGDFFGEMSFLDGEPRSADATAKTDTDLFVLSRKRFDTLLNEHVRLTINLMEGLSRTLALRLRRTDKELRVLQDM
jgi:sulfate permease, SulP family